MPATETVPSELLATVDRLENWGAWARDHSRGGQPIGSAEGKYTPERGGQEERRTPRLFIDALDAQVVGKGLAPAGGFPQKWFVLLKFRYCYRERPTVICRRVAIRMSDYPQELNNALRALKNGLTRHA